MQPMKGETQVETTAPAIWQRVIQLQGDLPSPAARALLRLNFSPEDQERIRQLAAKARAGTLTPEERVTADTYEQMGCLLDILHSKARRALRKRRTAS
jgi:hypothetical protein